MHNPAEQEMDAELAERFEAAVTAGIRQGQMELNRRQKQFRRRFAGAIAAGIMLFACLFTIKVSPVFAALIRDIPGLEKFVDLINNTSDKGIKLAVDNDFIQPVGVTEEHDGMKFTVQGIIADDSRMVVFYDIQIADKDESVRLDRPGLSDASGEPLPASISFNYPEETNQDTTKTGIQRGTADFQLTQGTTLPDEVLLKAGVGGTEFELKIPVDRARFARQQHEYVIGQTIHIEGQSVTFAKAVGSPLRISLYMDYSKDNTKQIFGAGDIRLVDDKGTVWKNISSSMVWNHPVYHFESPYFNDPKSLIIEGSWFRAIDKKRTSVMVDTEKGQLNKSYKQPLTLTLTDYPAYIRQSYKICIK